MLPHALDQPYERLIASGCDQRLIPGADGLNPYGASVLPRRAIALGSCSCSSPSPRATHAARQALSRLRRSSNLEQTIAELRAGIRSTLRRALKLSADIDIALTPSGTDLEMLAVAIVAGTDGREIVNVVVGPNEVGSGTCNAAAVRHYNIRLPRGGSAVVGKSVNTSLAARVQVEKINIRNSRAECLSALEIDAAVTDAVIQAISQDARVLVHLVAHSKTGIHAPSLGLLDRLTRTMKEDVVGIVDAAQGRLAPEAYQSALDRGLMVSFTGSKFFGGPPFAGALLVPQSLSPSSMGLKRLPDGLEDYFSVADFPESWFPLRIAGDDWFNTGGLLRWVAAAKEIETYFAIDHSIRRKIASAFSAAINDSLRDLPNVKLVRSFVSHSSEMMLENIESTSTVFSIAVTDANGKWLGKEELKRIHVRLNTGTGENCFHLGQPVKIGDDRYVLRIALGAPLLIDIATDLTWGATAADRIAMMKHLIDQLCNQIQRLSQSISALPVN